MTVTTDLATQLLEVLRASTGMPELDYQRRPEPMHGGFFAELFSFSLTDPPSGWPQELVARLLPYPEGAQKEAIVQRAVAAAGFPTPTVRVFGGPQSGLGRAFMVMDRADGRPMLSGLTGVAALTSGVRLLRDIPRVLAESMARLHALDPDLVRIELEPVPDVTGTVAGLLSMLAHHAAEFERADLVSVSCWLADHPPASASQVICHGDLHPFNLLVDGDRVTVLDWSTALLAPRAHDVAFTSLLLSEPPLLLPGWALPVARFTGRFLARRFVRIYQRQAQVRIGSYEVEWHQAVMCLRALVEVAGWVHDGVADSRTGHPWLVIGPALANRLAAVTGTPVRAR